MKAVNIFINNRNKDVSEKIGEEILRDIGPQYGAELKGTSVVGLDHDWVCVRPEDIQLTYIVKDFEIPFITECKALVDKMGAMVVTHDITTGYLFNKITISPTTDGDPAPNWDTLLKALDDKTTYVGHQRFTETKLFRGDFLPQEKHITIALYYVGDKLIIEIVSPIISDIREKIKNLILSHFSGHPFSINEKVIVPKAFKLTGNLTHVDLINPEYGMCDAIVRHFRWHI